ncbi:APC family permease [Ferrimicrobium acidiphilum]|uniref:APC family permease n=1 Tax=Ferrimicrobium acidiphilum TaxID=121039 RepID=UPI0023F47C2A|nr:APC family permease [Ferrimicrobium acidiphilum]
MVHIDDANQSEPDRFKEAGPDHYDQKLSRSLSTWGNIMITLSGVTPAVSVFAIAPVALVEAGSGTFLSFVFAAILGIVMALCWAELSSSYPISGGDYALVWHSFKGKAKPAAGPMSFITFALYVDFIAFIPATIALGAGEYLGAVFSVDAKILGAAIMLLAALVAMLKIRFNAILTGIFLGIEMLALLSLTILGIMHAHNFGALIHPQVGNTHNILVPVAFSAVLALTAVAVFSYNGYANAVNFAEETKGSHRTIAKAILISLLITVLAELIPVTAVIVGSPSLSKLTTSAIPLEYFIKATSNNAFYDVIAIGIALAVFNATLAIVLSYARILFSASRDRAWPGKLSDWMSWVHPKTQSPWLPTAIVGVAGAVLCLTVSLGTLANLTGASLVADYAIIAIAAIVARTTGATRRSHYKMPFWPIPPILALAGLVYIFTQQTAYLLEVTAITMGIGLLYWLIVILPQRGRAWDLREIATDTEGE